MRNLLLMIYKHAGAPRILLQMNSTFLFLSRFAGGTLVETIGGLALHSTAPIAHPVPFAAILAYTRLVYPVAKEMPRRRSTHPRTRSCRQSS
jgi:hypothetical protein